MTHQSVFFTKTGKQAFQLAFFFALSIWANDLGAQVKVTNAWVRATAPGQPAAAAYMKLTASRAVTLKSISTPIANRAELHETVIENDIVRMRPVELLSIAPGQTVTFRPGGLHIMLTDLTALIDPGTSINFRLTFVNDAGASRDIAVRAAAQYRPPTK